MARSGSSSEQYAEITKSIFKKALRQISDRHEIFEINEVFSSTDLFPDCQHKKGLYLWRMEVSGILWYFSIPYSTIEWYLSSVLLRGGRYHQGKIRNRQLKDIVSKSILEIIDLKIFY